MGSLTKLKEGASADPTGTLTCPPSATVTTLFLTSVPEVPFVRTTALSVELAGPLIRSVKSIGVALPVVIIFKLEPSTYTDTPPVVAEVGGAVAWLTSNTPSPVPKFPAKGPHTAMLLDGATHSAGRFMAPKHGDVPVLNMIPPAVKYKEGVVFVPFASRTLPSVGMGDGGM